MEKEIEYWKNNAEEDYKTTPISVLRYITEFENTPTQTKETFLKAAEEYFENKYPTDTTIDLEGENRRSRTKAIEGANWAYEQLTKTKTNEKI